MPKPSEQPDAPRSEFGQGLAYCLGLFLAHAGRDDEPARVGTWFNGASDHLYGLRLPSKPAALRRRLQEFKDKVLQLGHGFPEQSDRDWAIEEAKALLLEIDRANGIRAKEATWK